LITDLHSILDRWKKYFSHLLNIHGVDDVRQREIHTAEAVVPETSVFGGEIVIKKMISHKSPGIDQIPVKLVKAGCKTTRYEIHKLETSVFIKEELSEEMKESTILPVYKKAMKRTVVIIGAYQFCQLSTKSYPTSCC